MEAVTDSVTDFNILKSLNIPIKRAAYSDRTAWIMAILAELAYLPFDEESDSQILDLVSQLANLTNQQSLAQKLKDLQNSLATKNPTSDPEQCNAILKAALEAGGFQLAGDQVIHNGATDTQAFVAYNRDLDDIGMAVICFRGTKEVKDWLTNLEIDSSPVRDPNGVGVVGNMHKGFHDAYMSVHRDIAARLEGYEDLPLYITGHSLGGALSVVATWYQSSKKLAACYTFGAPRVGDNALIDRFKTPIYRIVNGPDPIPFVPPSGRTIDSFKSVVRFVGSILSVGGILEWVAARLVRIQNFRHYGYMRYLTVVDPGPKGDYPKLRVEFSLSSLERFFRMIGKIKSGKNERIDKYHSMSRYRAKLRAHAVRRNS